MPAATAPTQALPTQGYNLEIAPDVAGASGAYAPIGAIPVGELTLPDDSQKVYEFITNSSPGGVTERIPANQRTVGPTTFNLHANPALPVQTTLNGYYDARTKVWARFTSPDGSLVMIQVGWVTKRVFAVGDNPIMLNVEFTPTGGFQAGSTYPTP